MCALPHGKHELHAARIDTGAGRRAARLRPGGRAGADVLSKTAPRARPARSSTPRRSSAATSCSTRTPVSASEAIADQLRVAVGADRGGLSGRHASGRAAARHTRSRQHAAAGFRLAAWAGAGRREAIERAIELNGVAVPTNQAAFAWGRRAAVEPAALDALLGVTEEAPEPSDAAQLDASMKARASARYWRLPECGAGPALSPLC